MGEVTLYECDVTGERFGARNDVVEFDVRRHRHSPFATIDRTVHLSMDVLDEIDGSVPSGLEYVGVEDRAIVGACMATGFRPNQSAQWYDRDSVVIDHYEQFFQFVEREVLY